MVFGRSSLDVLHSKQLWLQAAPVGRKVWHHVRGCLQHANQCEDLELLALFRLSTVGLF